jgi:hypothetical protein
MRRINTSAWSTFLGHLDEYVQESGTAAVPEMHIEPDGYPLGRRAAYWRRQKGQLALSARQDLESRPGWYWDVTEVRWEARLRRLHSIAESHEGGRLRRADYLFVSRLRNQFEQLPQKERDLVVRLVGSGRDSSAHAFVKFARAWLERHPESDVSGISRREMIDIGGVEVHLGRQRAYVRERYWMTDPPGQKLSPGEIADIESLPGWTWRSGGGEQ